MGAGKSTGKSRLSGKRGDDRSAKRHKPGAAVQHGSIRQFLQPLPRGGPASRDSSSEPEDGQKQLPSQTPAVPLLPAAAAPPSGAPTAAHPRVLQTCLLRSLQHRFATQQSLVTPAIGGAPAAGGGNQLPQGGWAQEQQQQQQEQEQHGFGGALDTAVAVHASASLPDDDVEDGEDGFQIFSQLEYEPTFLSQRPPEVGADAGAPHGISQQDTQTQVPPWGSQQQQQQVPVGGHAGGGGIGPSRASAAQAAAPAWWGGGGGCGEDGGSDGGGDLEWPAGSQPQLTQPQSQQQQQDEVQRRVSGVSAASHKTTPALHSSERVRCDGAGPSGQKMFHMFRRRDSLKRLYIVRHGESTCNAAMAAKGSGWADPQIYDAQLTERGKQQARALRQQLAALDLPPDTLWLTSPLQRAVQTLLLGCPHAHLLGGASSGGSSICADAENSSVAPNGGSGAPSVVVLQSITEKVFTCGDIGHPASQLAKLYPQLGRQLAALPELWWHSPADKPNCALLKQFNSSESKDQVLARIGAFRRWLQDRPERVIVAVGHSSYWRAFEEVCHGSKPQHMRNCEVRLIHF